MYEENIQDRDGTLRIISLACARFPYIVHIVVDYGYARNKLEALAAVVGPAIEIFKKPYDIKGSMHGARRRIIKQLSTWVNRYRKHERDWEATIASSETGLISASPQSAQDRSKEISDN